MYDIRCKEQQGLSRLEEMKEIDIPTQVRAPIDISVIVAYHAVCQYVYASSPKRLSDSARSESATARF